MESDMTNTKPQTIAYVEGNLFDIVPDKMHIGDAETIYIPHVCNNAGLWGAGFVVPLAQKWPTTREQYLKAAKDGRVAYTDDTLSHKNLPEGLVTELPGYKPFDLGITQFVEVVEGRVIVCNMIAQDPPGSSACPLQYDSLEECMAQVAESVLADGANFPVICAPMFGAGLAGGKWEEIEKLIQMYWCTPGIPVSIFYIPGKTPAGWTPPKAV